VAWRRVGPTFVVYGLQVKVPPAIETIDLAQPTPKTPLSRVISAINKHKRLTIYFLYLGNLALLVRERVVSYTALDSLTRHFNRKHVRKLKEYKPLAH
jgi:hypothetical protein